jgi:predicted nucleic acid-binding protein
VRYLFDTDTLSELMRRAPSPGLLRRLAATAPEDQATSSVTLGELLYGAHRLRERSTDLIERVEQTVTANLPILPFDADAAREYGSLRAHLEAEGTPIGDADMRIASIALAGGLVVVTGNVRHFERVPSLAVENWLV